MQDLIPMPVRDIDFICMTRGKPLENLNWKNELRSKFIEAYSLAMQIVRFQNDFKISLNFFP